MYFSLKNQYIQRIRDANYHFIQKNYDISLEMYNSLISKFPQSIVYSNRGIIYYHMNLFKLAINDFRTSLLLDENNTTSFYYLKLIMNRVLNIREKEYDELREEIIQKEPECIDLFFLMNDDIRNTLYPNFNSQLNQIKKENKEIPEITIVKNNQIIQNHTLSVDQIENIVVSNIVSNIVTNTICNEVSNVDDSLVQLMNQQEELEMGERMKNTIDIETKQLIGTANILTNSGKYVDALTIYNTILEKYPKCDEVYIGRGIIYSFEKRYDDGLIELAKAEIYNSNNPTIYRIRYQIYLQSGKVIETIKDLSKYLKLCPNDIDMIKNRAIYYYNNKLYRQSYTDLLHLIKIKQEFENDTNILTICGMCLQNLGYSHNAIEYFERSLQINPALKDNYINMSTSYRDLADYKNSLRVLNRLYTIDPNFISFYSISSFTYYILGNSTKAILYNERANAILVQNKVDENVDVSYQIAIAYMSEGKIRRALEYFNKILEVNSKHAAAYYQREVGHYIQRRMNSSIDLLQFDNDFNANLKEAIARKSTYDDFMKTLKTPYVPFDGINTHINDITVDEMNQMRDQISSKFAYNEILDKIDRYGEMMQNKNIGFMKNKKQYRMAGLGSLHTAQILRNYIESLRNRVTGIKPITWRKFMDLLTRWRQISEPNDPVWWIDQLTQESYEIGFGLQTPTYSNQMKIQRYYSYYPYSMELMKKYTLEQWPLTDSVRMRISAAKDCDEIREIMGSDYFIIVPCRSIVKENKIMEGTRITILKKDIDLYEFMIRTPVTPYRWKEFNEEFTYLWIQIITELVKPNNERNYPKLYKLVIYFYYYWVCFAPLSRGTAMVGLMFIQTLFLAMGREIDMQFVEGQIVDWEAILRTNPEEFYQRIERWFINDGMREIEDLPNIDEFVDTYRNRLIFINLDLDRKNELNEYYVL
jgi:tetratricopeptide (TPR) repeat protein